jgi:hypothetical protein
VNHKTSDTLINLSEIRHHDEVNDTNIDFRNKDSKILQDPITPHANKLDDILKSKQLNKINNVFNDKQGNLNHFVKNIILNGKENEQDKTYDKLRVYSINRIASIKSRQNVQIKKMNQPKKETKMISHRDNIPDSADNTIIKKNESKTPVKSKMVSDDDNSD